MYTQWGLRKGFHLLPFIYHDNGCWVSSQQKLVELNSRSMHLWLHMYEHKNTNPSSRYKWWIIVYMNVIGEFLASPAKNIDKIKITTLGPTRVGPSSHQTFVSMLSLSNCFSRAQVSLVPQLHVVQMISTSSRVPRLPVPTVVTLMSFKLSL